jgi:hypothetical protein
MNKQINKIWIWSILFPVFMMLFMINEKGHTQSSENYQIIKSVISQGGSSSQSANYQAVAAVGQSAVGASSSENYTASFGFLAGGETGYVKVDNDEIVIPEEFRLLQNYPNPFNPETVIEYHLPAPADVALFIYNLEGKIVRRFDKKSMSAGVHSFLWKGRNEAGIMVSSGTYFFGIEVKTNNKTLHIVKKMILIK